MMNFRIRPAIVLFGDSLTQFSFGESGGIGWDLHGVGWGSLLASAYQRRADVFNRGFSGYNTRFAREVLPRVFGKSNGEDDNADDNGILFATVFLGANDATIPGERQHVPIDEYGTNLEYIISSIRSRCGTPSFPIFVLSPPPVDQEAWRKHREIDYFDRTNENSRAYGLVAKRVAEKLGCCFIDTWKCLGGDGPASDYGKHLSDGLHLTESGNRLIFDELLGLIRKDFPQLAPMVDGDERYGEIGIPVEEKIWTELC